jgi:hypothetical protein
MIPYDSYEGFQMAISSLDLFNALIKKRHNAGYVRHERLLEWVILGRFFFDSCGNCMKFTGDPVPIEVFPNLPPVMTNTEFWKYVKQFSPPNKEYSFTCSMGDDIPPAGLICPVCRTGWTIQNCHDTILEHESRVIKLNQYGGTGVMLGMLKDLWSINEEAVWRLQPERSIRNDKYIDHSIVQTEPGRRLKWQVNERGWISPDSDYRIQPGDEALVNIWTYRHHECHRKHLAKTELEYFHKVFAEAGYQKVRFTRIPNQYCTCERCAPWYKVNADGIPFTIGWRKRVISIQSTDPRIVFDKIFPKEDVTKFTHEIHAWGREKCIEYLSTIRKLVK